MKKRRLRAAAKANALTAGGIRLPATSAEDASARGRY